MRTGVWLVGSMVNLGSVLPSHSFTPQLFRSKHLWKARLYSGGPAEIQQTPWPKLLTVCLVGEVDVDTNQL